MTVKQSELAGWIGHTLVDDHGDKIGKITDLYADEATGEPEWIAVKTGRIGSKLNFVPLAGAEPSGDDLQVPYDSDMVKHAPEADPDGRLSQEEEARLYGHYGMTYSTERSPSGLPETGRAGGPVGRDTSGPTTDDAMTRSEEELRVGRESKETGRARLHKYVVTEEETRTVPVTKEKVRVEREPITDANADRAMAGPDISDEEHEVVLHEERPVVGKETVPKERVRLARESETEEREITEEVRKERIEEEGDVPPGR
ncbi:MAG: PRC and DUF2382 domain-containing protein [Acidimicrobiales bacterium]|nr:PRC and DUF2382 domain-containing protein [Acidimicrobiales bacterium]